MCSSKSKQFEVALNYQSEYRQIDLINARFAQRVYQLMVVQVKFLFVEWIPVEGVLFNAMIIHSEMVITASNATRSQTIILARDVGTTDVHNAQLDMELKVVGAHSVKDFCGAQVQQHAKQHQPTVRLL